MSAPSSALSVEVDLDGGVATADLFDGGERRLWADEDGWRGFREEDGAYYWVDTRYDAEEDVVANVRVGEGAVQTTIQRYLAGEPVAAPHGRVIA